MVRVFLFLLILLFQPWSFGQEDVAVREKSPFSIYAGIGFPEIVHIGPRIRAGQTRFGAYFGGWKNRISAGGDLYVHFGKPSNYSTLNQGYFRFGYNFQKVEREFSTNEFSHVILCIGRDVYEDEHVGISIDIGATFRVYQVEYNTNYPPPPPPDLDDLTIELDLYKNSVIYPSISVVMFYRI